MYGKDNKGKETLDGFGASKKDGSTLPESESLIIPEEIDRIKRLIQLIPISMDKLLQYLEHRFTISKLEELKEADGLSLIAELKGLIVRDNKIIDIDWDHLSPIMLGIKLFAASEYTVEDFDYVEELGGAVCAVTYGKKYHLTSLKWCNCGEWTHRGNSLSPCKHQLRMKYRVDEELQKELSSLLTTGERSQQAKPKAVVADVPFTKIGLMIEQIVPRLPEIGKIKIGGKGVKTTQSGFLLPEKWDHFEIATMLKDKEGRLIMDTEMNKLIGEGQRELDIFLCYDDPRMNMPSFYAKFTQSRMECMGNGKIALRRVNGNKEEIVCKAKQCPDYKAKKCHPYGRLSVILAKANRIGGSYVFRTISWNSIQNVLSSMALIRDRGGVLAGIPLKMRLMPMTVMPVEVGHNVNIWVINIEFAGTMDELKVAGEKEVERRLKVGLDMRQIEANNRLSLEAHVIEEAEEESAEIASEFAPESG